LYGKEGKTDLASSCFKEIINKATDSNQLATAYDNYAYFSKLKPLAKIVYYEKAIQTILALKQSTFILPELQTIIESGYQQDIMVYLVDLASNYVETFKATHEKIYLLKAKDVLYLIDKIVSIIRYESSSEQSKLFWIEKGVNTYLLGTEVCYLLNEPHEGFYFMEKNKALLLQENIKTYQAKLELLLPQEIRDKEFKLHYEYVLAEIKLQQFPNNKSIRAAYIKKHREFESFMRSLTHQYPEYVKLKHKIDIMPLQKVIRALKNNECFVTYILNNDKGYGLFANTSNTYFFKIDNITQLYQDSNLLRKLHTQFSFQEQEKKKFQQISHRVFTTLFPFTNALQKVKGKKLTIIADGILLHLPFEALCVNRYQKLQESYLINFTEISYLQSYSTFEKIKHWKNKPSKKLLAIIPYQFTNKKLEMLARSKELVAPLGRYASSTILFDSQANKEIFKNISNQYEIIHLNTHAGVDNSNQMPWIAFQNSKMTLQELYGVSNHASLVILDACKTNDGKVLSGEGIFSLSRGFFMNGTKSVLSSLWNVNEKAGNEIISSFYKELEKGTSKSKALQLAKISYLKNHQLSEIVPYHWASFVLTGETATLQLKQKWYYNEGNIIVVIILIVITLFVVFSLKFLKK
jgi:CHAT domain-containing protein